MRALLLLLVVTVAGCGVESTFIVDPKSGIPPGLEADLQGQDTSGLRVEIWFYTSDPVTLKVFDAAGTLILERQGTWRSPNAGESADFYVTVNGVESGYFQPAKGTNNLVEIVLPPVTQPAATQPFVGEVVPASAKDIEALIAERGSLTFLSWNGRWIGMDGDTDITFLPGGAVHMFEYGIVMTGYRGTYTIDAEGTIAMSLPNFGHEWPVMSLLKDDSSLLLMPKEEAAGIVMGNRSGMVVPSGRGGYWPFRPIPAEEEANARKDIAERGGR